MVVVVIWQSFHRGGNVVECVWLLGESLSEGVGKKERSTTSRQKIMLEDVFDVEEPLLEAGRGKGAVNRASEDEDDGGDGAAATAAGNSSAAIAASMAKLPAAVRACESACTDRAECESLRIADRAQSPTRRFLFYARRWLLTSLVAVFAAAVALGMHEGAYYGRLLNNRLTRSVIDSTASRALGGLTHVAVGFAFAAAAGAVVFVLDPSLRGVSTNVLASLNGLVVQGTLSVKNLLSHALSLTFVTASPVCVGREGPFLAIGAQCGAAVARIGGLDETESRNFVSCGLGAGIAAAFGAPAGAVLFALEESFHFSMGFLRRLLFTSMLTTFTLSLLITGFDEWRWGDIGLDSLCHFGQFPSRIYGLEQVAAWVMMGVIGGLVGATFNFLHILVMRFKKWLLPTPARRFAEVAALGLVTAAVVVTFVALLPECRALPGSSDGGSGVSLDLDLQQGFCAKGEYSQSATLFTNMQETAMHWLFHESAPVSITMLGLFFIIFFAFAVYSLGSGIPAGFFMPSLMIGAVLGRFLGEWGASPLRALDVDPGLMSFIGAAAVLGGTCRMPVSLAVIMSEATNQASNTLYLMLTLIVAKWVGDIFTPAIVAIDFRLNLYPILEWSTPTALRKFRVDDVMHRPLVMFSRRETIGRLRKVLAETSHNGFPVVADAGVKDSPLIGIVLRSQIEEILRLRSGIGVSGADESEVDLTSRINDAVVVPNVVSCARAFTIFRTNGLRHLVVVATGTAVPVGIITRKDLFFLHANIQERERRLQNRSCFERIRAALYGHAVH